MSGPLRLRHRVLEAVRAHELWRAGEVVTIACSGGRDSVVLLDVLHLTQRAHGATLRVLVVDHATRPGSAEDATFVAELAAARQLPCRVMTLAPGPADEATLRARRRQAFAAEPGLVATGHHQQDQAETVLLQLMRGGGAEARGGMRWRREGVVRPLLATPPEELAAYAAARQLAWRDDPTNASPAYLRNRVRHEVLPLLASLRPGVVATLAAGARHAAEEADLLADLAADALARHRRGDGLSRQWVGEGPAALVRRAVRLRWPGLSRGQVDAVLQMARRGRGRVQTADGGVLVVVDDAVQADEEQAKSPQSRGGVGEG